jgi:hypothetical protein
MKLSAIMLVLSLAGCATALQQPLITSSGRPEVTIQRATRPQIQSALVQELAANGATLKSTNEYQLVFSKPDQSIGSSIAYGTSFAPTPELRLTFTFADSAGGVRVFGQAAMVSNPGSGYERTHDVTEGVKHDIQGARERLRVRF